MHIPGLKDVKCEKCHYPHKTIDLIMPSNGQLGFPIWTCPRCNHRNGEKAYKDNLLERAKKNGMADTEFRD